MSSLLGTGLHSRPFDLDDSSWYIASYCYLLLRSSCFGIHGALSAFEEHSLGLEDLLEVVLLLVRNEALVHNCLKVCLIRRVASHRLLT